MCLQELFFLQVKTQINECDMSTVNTSVSTVWNTSLFFYMLFLMFVMITMFEKKNESKIERKRDLIPLLFF